MVVHANMLQWKGNIIIPLISVHSLTSRAKQAHEKAYLLINAFGNKIYHAIKIFGVV